MENETKKTANFWHGLKEKIVALANKFGEYAKANYPVFIAPIFTAFIYVVSLYLMGAYPFSDEYTVSSYDLSSQICPYIEHLFDVMQGKSQLFHSFSVAAGADVFGTFTFFFISPFSFIFLLFGDGRVAYASGLVMTLKLAAIAFAGSWFAHKQFKGIPRFLSTAIGVLYAFCGYTFVSNTYIGWMDLIIYSPFVVYAFRRFVETGKYLPFAIMIAVCIYTCFSITSFALLTVFPALICYGFICVEKEKRNKFLAELCIAFVIAVLISLPVLVPSLIAYLDGARGGDLFVNTYWGLNDDGTFNAESFVDWWKSGFTAKWSYILSDVAFVILTIAYFFKSGLKDKLSKFMLVAAVFTLLPTIVDESMNLLNMGSYMCYALRFGFLNVLFFMSGACLFLEGFCYKNGYSYDGEKITKKKEVKTTFFADDSDTQNAQTPAPVYVKSEELSEEEQEKSSSSLLTDAVKFFKKFTPRWQHFVCVGVVAILFGVLCWFLGTDTYIRIWENVEGAYYSPADFAHTYGGLPVITVIFIVIGIGFLVCGIFAVSKKVGMRFVSVCICALLGVQIIFFSHQIVLGNLSTQHHDLNDFTAVCEQIEDDSYYRVKDYNETVTKDAPFQTGAPAYSIFSSMVDKKNFELAKLFNYDGNGRNSIGSSKGNYFGDAFLGYKYFVIPTDNKVKVEKLSYAKPAKHNVDGVDEFIRGDRYSVFENEIVFPLAYTVQKEPLKFSRENSLVNSASNQVELYRWLMDAQIQNQLVTVSDVRTLADVLRSRAVEFEVGQGTIHASVTATADENLMLNFVALDGYKVFVNGKQVEFVENDLALMVVPLVEGENSVEIRYSSPYPKYALISLIASVLGLVLAAFVIKKTKVVEKVTPVIAWCGVGLGVAVTGFFFVFPTVVWLWKLIRLFFPFFF